VQGALILSTGLLCLGCFGQDLLPKDASSKTLLNTDALTAYALPPYHPITLKQKYIYSIEQMFSGPRLISILARAGVDQAEVYPRAWGSDSPAYGVRVASLFGRSFVRATVASGIRAIDHEDPRYFYSHKKNPWDRTKYAVVHTFEVRNDSGRMMPAYSRFIGDFGMPFLAQTWHPGAYNAKDAMTQGMSSIGVGMAMNVAIEFWPDVRHAFHMGPGVTSTLISPGHVH
jgi:hypothetical protein